MRWFFLFSPALFLCPLLTGQGTTPAETNPFFEDWKTPFGVPPFERIKNEHFLPALKKGIEENRREVEAIANDRRAANFANTIEALDNTGELLSKVTPVFYGLAGAETNDTIEAVSKEVAPLMSALRDDVYLNEKLFARVKSVWERREKLKLTAEQRRLVEETYKSFVRAGANLGPKEKERLRAINSEMSLLHVRFAQNLLRETNNFRLVVENKADLAGLPESSIQAAAAAAKAAKLDGKWLFTLHAPSVMPFLEFADNRELRRQIWTAYAKRGDNGNEFDNKEISVKIAKMRAERSQLLGFKTFAHYALEERMAQTPERVYELLNQLWEPALGVAKRERADMQELVRKEGHSFKLEPWDWRYYAQKVKKERYALEDSELRPYFSISGVLQGAFDVATKLYGLKFEERTDIPKYHSEVRTFEVKDADESHLGIFLVDFHPRPGKRGGAWASTYRGQRFKDGKDIRPVVVNVCNFTRPGPETPALINLEETETLFHEFGHGLHMLLSKVRYRGLSGVPRDFVELPSQIMEHWAVEPQVLRAYAKHFQTGKPISEELIQKIERSGKFNQGFATVEYLASSFLDMDWHLITGKEEIEAAAFERAALDKIGLIPEIIARHRSPHFQHIFGSYGYAAGYYSYIWSEVLDTDAFQAFKEKGDIFHKNTATAFRKQILERGGSAEAMDMYKAFRGREPVVQPLLEKRGLTGKSD